jgi:lipopolysaccharide/colanic/teichoic acid biosynthesis glycosyltransferase
MKKRIFDLLLTVPGFLVLLPVFIVLLLLIKMDSKGPIFYLQERIGKGFKPFRLFKFRTMIHHADKQGLLTVGMKDSRITRIGYYLRKYKLDELPQLLNVIIGDMSLVGPRPEVKKYVDMYTPAQQKVLLVKPGITDLASIKYSNENEILAKFTNPEMGYITQVMPDKLQLNLDYIQRQSVLFDLQIIFATVFKIAI